MDSSTRHHIRVAAIMIALGAAALFLVYRQELLGRYLANLTSFTASMSFSVLKQLGMCVEQRGTVVSDIHGFAYEIQFRCTGILPACAFALSILASPANGRRKLIGLALGIPLVFLLNMVRLIHLFFIGVYRPEWFNFAHHYAWEGAIILGVLALWLAWRSCVCGPTQSALAP
jgi:exosortase H (IPTLxxWG-CTERM-specific)